MSSIDNRIVQMQFENSQFEKGIKESLKSLDDLEKKLEFKDAERGLAALQKAGDSFSLAKMADGIEKINEKFSLLGIVGKRVLENLTDSAVRMGEQFIKSVSIDQISAGWNKYADKTAAVQTIIAATGKDIEYVDEQLSKLAWFTDETSYNFVDMTSNIGKFTSMGIDLETSVTAMEGIATWAAVSGQNAQTASRAMYNMSQAIGVGSVKLMDWKSIENANMATKEFKQTAIETAKALGKLNAKGKTAKGTAVTFENFSQTLSQGWFTKDVLLKTLEKYGEYADAVYTVSTEKGIPAAQAMELVSGETMKLGEKAFKAAQEAKTFTEAIDSVKDAVSTGWMNIFEKIFGNYEEAKVLWTDLANYLWDMFAAPLSDTVDLLDEWKKLGGRTKALEGIYAIFEAIADIIATIKDAIASVFPEITAEKLYEFSEGIAEFGKQFRSTFNRYENEIKIPKRKEDELAKAIDVVNNGYGKERVEAIRKVQDELVRLGYLQEDAFVSGTWGLSSEKALANFQNGIKDTNELLETTLKFGDKGKEVEEFQRKLKELNFDPGAIDGIWGPKTQKAYEKYIDSLGDSAKAYKTLKKGMNDDDVTRLQMFLIREGEMDAGQADGVFGPLTEKAVKKWQKAHGLMETGIVDKETYDAMFPEKAQEAGEAWEYETETIVDYSDKMKNLLYITKGLASALHILTSFFGFLGKVVVHIGSLFSPLIDAFIAIAAALGTSITAFDKWLQEAGVFDKWFEDVKKFLEPFGQWIQKAADGLLAFFGITKNAKDSNGEMMTFAKLWKNITDAVKKTGIIDKITKAWESFTATIAKVKESLKGTKKAFKDNLGKEFKGILDGIPGAIASVIEWFGNLATKGLNLITPWIEKIPDGIQKIKNFWGALTQEGDPAKNQAPGFLIRVRDAFRSVIDFLFGDGDIAAGKSPGVFRRLGRLIMGDLEGFTEGMDENTKKKILGIIENIKVFIQKVREGIFYLFGGKLSDDKKISDETLAKIDKFKEGFNKVIEAIGLLFTGQVKENSRLSQETIDRIINIRNTIIGVFEVVKNALINIWNTIVGVFNGEIKFESIGEFFTSFWESVKQFFSDLTGVAAENLGNAWTGIEKFFSSLWNGIKNLGKWLLIGFAVYKVIKLFSNFSNVLGTLKSTIKSYRKDTQPLSKSILEFAAAIGIIAASIWLIGQLDEKQFTRGVAAVGGIIAILLVLLGVFAFSDKFKGASESMKKFGNAVKEIGIGIGAIVLAIIVLGAMFSLKSDLMWTGIAGLVGIMALLVIFIAIVNKVGGANLKLKGFWQLAIVIAVMSYIAVKLGKVPIPQLATGIIALGVIMAMLAGFVYIMGKVGANKIKMKGFIGLSIAIGILAIIAVKLGKIKDQGKLWRGIGAIAAIMAMVAGMAFVMGKWGKDIKVGTLITLFLGMIILIAVFGYVINAIKDVDPSVLYGFSISLGIALAAFVAACLIVGKIEGGAKAMVSGAAAIGAAFDVLVALVGGLVLGLGAWNEATGGAIEEDIRSGGRSLRAIGEALSGFIESLNMSKGEFALLLGACALIGLLGIGGDLIGGAAAIGTAFDILVGLIGALIAGLGELDKVTNGSIEIDIDRGSAILIKIGKAVNGFGESLKVSRGDLAILIGACALIGLLGGELWLIGGAAGIAAAFDVFVIITGALIAGLGKINEATDGGVIEAIESGGEVLKSIGKAIGSLTAGMLEANNEGLSGFADALSAINAATEGLSEDETLDDDIQKALDVAQKIHGFFSNLTLYTIDTNGVEGYATAASQISTDMGMFGRAVNDFRIGIIGIADEKTIDADTDKAIGVAKNIKEKFFDIIAEQMPNGQGLIDYNNSVKTVITNVEEFAEAMGTFHVNIAGFNSPGIEEDTGAAITAATAVADFLVDLKGQSDKIEHNKTAFDAFLTGDTAQSTVFESIKTLSENIAQSRIDLKGLGAGTYAKDLGAAIMAIDQLATTIAKFHEENIAYGYSEENVDALLGWLGEIGKKVVDLNQDFKNKEVDTTGIGLILNSVTKLASILSGEGVNAISTKNFLSGIDLEDVTTQLSEFSTYLGTAIDGTVEEIKGYTESFSNAGVELSNSLATGITTPTSSGIDLLMLKMLAQLDGYKKSFTTLGQNFTAGLAAGVHFQVYTAIKAANYVAQKMLDAVQRAFDSHSPSKETAKFGNYFTEGLAVGTEDKIGQATNAASNVADSMLSTASGTLATLSELLADDIDVNPVIAPVVDLTQARESAALIGGLFGNPSVGVTSSVLAKDAMVSTNNGRPITIQNGTMSTTESLGSVTEQLNALTSYLTARNDGPHVSEMESLTEKFGDLAEAVTGLKIVLDTGTLVGELTPALDTGLGNYAAMRDRGN